VDIEGLRREYPEVGWQSFGEWAGEALTPQAAYAGSTSVKRFEVAARLLSSVMMATADDTGQVRRRTRRNAWSVL
jgi:hypothetical protein